MTSSVLFKHLPHYLTFELGYSRNISHLLWPVNQCELTVNGFGCYNMAFRGRIRKFSAYRANARESKSALTRNIYASVMCVHALNLQKHLHIGGYTSGFQVNSAYVFCT